MSRRWQDNVATQYTDPQIKVMVFLQNRKIIFTSEIGITLSDVMGDGLVMDIFLSKPRLRIECDSDYFHKGRDLEEEDKDRRLLELHRIRTIRLDNDKIMLASGKTYIEEMLKPYGVFGEER